MIVGLKKLNNDNVTKTLNNENTKDFSISRLLLSIFIGFVAGAIGLLIKGDPIPGAGRNEYILTIMAAGYSGTDFIEGVFKTYISKLDPKAQKKDNSDNNADYQQPLKVADESLPLNTQSKG